MLESRGFVEAGGAERFGVVVYQPHLDPDLTTVGLDTPDGRRWDLTPDDALALAELLSAAPAALDAARHNFDEEGDD